MALAASLLPGYRYTVLSGPCAAGEEVTIIDNRPIPDGDSDGRQRKVTVLDPTGTEAYILPRMLSSLPAVKASEVVAELPTSSEPSTANSKGGRPRVFPADRVQLNTRVSKDTRDRLKRHADRRGLSVTSMVDRAIHESLDRWETDDVVQARETPEASKFEAAITSAVLESFTPEHRDHLLQDAIRRLLTGSKR